MVPPEDHGSSHYFLVQRTDVCCIEIWVSLSFVRRWDCSTSCVVEQCVQQYEQQRFGIIYRFLRGLPLLARPLALQWSSEVALNKLFSTFFLFVFSYN